MVMYTIISPCGYNLCIEKYLVTFKNLLQKNEDFLNVFLL